MAYQIFLSYSRADSTDFAVRLAEQLEQYGISTWIDRKIGTGRRWTTEIENAMRSSTHVLVVLSPGSAQSPNVGDEINFALDEGKHILPVLYKPCSIPLRLRSLQYVDFVNQPYHQAFHALLDIFRQTTTLHTHAASSRSAWTSGPGHQGLRSSPIGQQPPLVSGTPTASQSGQARSVRVACVTVVLLVALVIVGLFVVIGPRISDVLAELGIGSPSVVATVEGPWVGRAGNLHLAVDKVDRLRDGKLRVWMTRQNDTGDSLSLPLFGYFVATDNTGTGYKASTWGNEWIETIPNGTTVSGYVLLDKPATQDASSMAVSFTQIFGSLSVPNSITIHDIPIPSVADHGNWLFRSLILVANPVMCGNSIGGFSIVRYSFRVNCNWTKFSHITAYAPMHMCQLRSHRS